MLKFCVFPQQANKCSCIGDLCSRSVTKTYLWLQLYRNVFFRRQAWYVQQLTRYYNTKVRQLQLNVVCLFTVLQSCPCPIHFIHSPPPTHCISPQPPTFHLPTKCPQASSPVLANWLQLLMTSKLTLMCKIAGTSLNSVAALQVFYNGVWENEEMGGVYPTDGTPRCSTPYPVDYINHFTTSATVFSWCIVSHMLYYQLIHMSTK